MRVLKLLSALSVTAILVVACGSGDTSTDTIDPTADAGTFGVDASPPPPPSSDGGTAASEVHTVGGTVTGLQGSGLVLQNNSGDDLTIKSDGSFTFAKPLPKGAAFAVTIKTQPTNPAQTCSVSGGTGTIASGNVTSITVNCAPAQFTVGGTITGLAGAGLILQNNAGDDLVVNSNGTFAFKTTLATGKPYAVTVKTQPSSPSQTCTVTAGTGTIDKANVSNVTIACTTNKYTVGGTVSGLAGTGLVLKVNGGDALPVAANGAFTFPTAIASGTAFTVTVGTQPSTPNQTCAVTGGTGTVGGANVTSVAVNCTTNKYTIGGTATGILGTAVLQNNGGDDLNVNAAGNFAFATPITDGQPYAVTIKTQPGAPSQTCSLANDSGNVAGANVTNVALTCVTNKFKIKGNVTGLAGSGLVLQDNSGDDLAVTQDGAFEFATSIDSGKTYTVTVKTQPTSLSQTCTVTKGNGMVGAADVTDVTVTCATNSYSVGGTISGLKGTGLVLQDNNGDDLTVPANATTFTFATKILSGASYAVTVKTQPGGPAQTCFVTNATGTVTSANVASVTISCSDGYCKPFDLNGFACPSGKSMYCSPTPLDASSATQAQAACQSCYNATCFLENADCAGPGYGPNPAGQYQCGKAYFGYTSGCSGASGRIWPICSSFTTYGRWAP